MAESVPFKGVNRIFEIDPKHSEGNMPSMLPMHGYQGNVLTYTCWKLSPEELEEINRTGEVWLAARCGPRAMQPHWLGSLSFIKWACAEMGKMWNPNTPMPPALPAPDDPGLEPA